MVMRLEPPTRFDFSKPDQWPKWKRRFEQFRSASKLNKEPEPQQVDTLLYLMGEEADSVLRSTNCTVDERKDYNVVTGILDSYFKVRRNVTFERARFNRRSQKEGETAEQFITDLYELVEYCNYGALKDEMLRDRIVIGIRDLSLSERMQTDAELTLEKAKRMVRQKAAVKDQRKELQQQEDAAVLQSLRQSTTRRRRGQPQGAGATDNCTKCGYRKHNSSDRCPAAGATCHKCNRVGHFRSVCFSKRTAEITTQHETQLETQQDSTTESGAPGFLGEVGQGSQQAWFVDIYVHGKIVVKFKMDTGAEVTAISETIHKYLGKPKLRAARRVLFGPAHQELDVMGEFVTWMKHGHQRSRQRVYVISGLQSNLLSLPALTHLKLVDRIDSTTISDPHQEIIKQFPEVFSGLGTIGEEYKTKLRQDATPYALFWSAGMVVVLKKSGAVRICVDLKSLYENVLREPHPILQTDDTLAQLAGASYFSKLDANSGFWQIPLADESRPLTTFITPFGRYHFNKLPFGISCAPELFQLRMHKILNGLEGVACLLDDVLIFGSSKDEHDRQLIAVLQRLVEAGVTLNRDKCEFNKESIKFLGHIINKEGIRADPDETSTILDMKAPQSVSDLCQFMELVNQLGKFSPALAERLVENQQVLDMGTCSGRSIRHNQS